MDSAGPVGTDQTGQDALARAAPGGAMTRRRGGELADELRALRQAFQEQRRALAIHDELARLALDEGGLDELIEVLARRLGRPSVVENRFGVVLAASPRGLGGEIPASGVLRRATRARSLWSRMERGGQPVRVPAGLIGPDEPGRLLAPIAVGGEVVGVLSIVGEGTEPTMLDRELALIAREACLSLGLAFARHRAVLEGELRPAGRLLDLLLTGAETFALAEALRVGVVDFDSTAPHALLVVAPDPAHQASPATPVAPTPRDLIGLLSPWLERAQPRSLVGDRDGYVVVLVPQPTEGRSGPSPSLRARGADVLTRLPTAAARLVASVRAELGVVYSGPGCNVAVAPQIADWREIGANYRVARRILAALAAVDQRGVTVATTDPRLATFALFDATDPAAIARFVELILGPILAYDARRGRALLTTIEAFVAQGGHLEATARILGIHTSTLKYRLARIAALSGLDLRDADQRFNAALALKLRAVVTPPAET